MRKFSFIAIFLSFFLVSQMAIATYDEDNPFIEMDEAAAANFFMLDVEDVEIPLDGAVPDISPCDGIITSQFGWRRYSRRHRRGRFHKGVDIAAPRGTSIVAPAPGRVSFVGRKGGYGNTVILDHGGSLTTLFAHSSEITVEEGEYVTKGQEIALVGTSGRSTGPHLHYEVRVDGVPVNPSRFF